MCFPCEKMRQFGDARLWECPRNTLDVCLSDQDWYQAGIDCAAGLFQLQEFWNSKGKKILKVSLCL